MSNTAKFWIILIGGLIIFAYLALKIADGTLGDIPVPTPKASQTR